MSFQKVKNIGLYLIYLVVFTLVMAEVILKIYNPFAFRIRGYDIVLPAGQQYEIEMKDSKKFEPKIIHTKNSLGFRGPEKPTDWSEKLTIVTVGGSTTECYYVSDSLTWPYQLSKELVKSCPSLWLNNAGLNGHSTFGHQVLLDKYLIQLKPKIIVFLVGINDLDRQDLNNFDGSITEDKTQGIKDWVVNHSELANVFLNIKRYMRANAMLGLSHNLETVSLKEMKTLKMSDGEIEAEVSKQKTLYLSSFSQRVSKLIETCKKNNIEPILVTQPLLFGEGIDPTTGVDLATVKTAENQNGRLYWSKLEIYNREVVEIGKRMNTFTIDLAHLMPKNSLYYYDAMHFTYQGCAELAQIMSQNMTPYLQKKYSNCK